MTGDSGGRSPESLQTSISESFGGKLGFRAIHFAYIIKTVIIRFCMVQLKEDTKFPFEFLL